MQRIMMWLDSPPHWACFNGHTEIAAVPRIGEINAKK
jgi:hypothetical protein